MKSLGTDISEAGPSGVTDLRTPVIILRTAVHCGGPGGVSERAVGLLEGGLAAGCGLHGGGSPEPRICFPSELLSPLCLIGWLCAPGSITDPAEVLRKHLSRD